MSTNRLDPETVLRLMLDATMFVQQKTPISGTHNLSGYQYTARFADRWSALYVEMTNPGARWDHVYHSNEKAHRPKAPKIIQTWSADQGITVRAPSLPDDESRVTRLADPWDVLAPVETAASWASNMEANALMSVVIGDRYAASFADHDGIVVDATHPIVPAGSHVRTSMLLADLFIAGVADVVEEDRKLNAVSPPGTEPEYALWHDDLAVYIRAHVPRQGLTITLQFQRKRGDDPRVHLVEKAKGSPAGKARVWPRSLKKAIDAASGAEKPVTLIVSPTSFSMRCGRLTPFDNASPEGTGEAVVSSVLLHDALWWFKDESVVIGLPERADEPIVVSQPEGPQSIVVLPWG